MDKETYDMDADMKFINDNFQIICRLHKGRTIVVHRQMIIFTAATHEEAYNKASALGALGRCVIKEITGRKNSQNSLITLGSIYG